MRSLSLSGPSSMTFYTCVSACVYQYMCDPLMTGSILYNLVFRVRLCVSLFFNTCLSLLFHLSVSASVFQSLILCFTVRKVAGKRNQTPKFFSSAKACFHQLSYYYAVTLTINQLYGCICTHHVWTRALLLYAMFAWKRMFTEVCEVENVNFSQQADEAAIRNLCMCGCVVDHLFTRLLTIFASYLSDLQLLSTPVPVWKCVW